MAEVDLVRSELAVLQMFLQEMHQPSNFRGRAGLPPLWQETTTGPLILRSPKQEIGRYLAAMGLLLQEDGPVDIGREERRFAWQVLPLFAKRMIDEVPGCSPAPITTMVIDTASLLCVRMFPAGLWLIEHLKRHHRTELKQCRDAVNGLLGAIAPMTGDDWHWKEIRSLLAAYGESHHFPLNHFAEAGLMDFLASNKKKESWDKAIVAKAANVFAEVAQKLAERTDRLDATANNVLANGVVRLARQAGTESIPTLQALGLAFARRIPGSGAMSVKGFSAVLDGLVEIGTEEAASVVVHLSDKAQTPTMRESASKRLDKLAFKQGVTPEQLLDAAVPTFDLDSTGVRGFAEGLCVFPSAQGSAVLAVGAELGADSLRTYVSEARELGIGKPLSPEGRGVGERGFSHLLMADSTQSKASRSSFILPKLKKTPAYKEALVLQKEMQKALTVQRKRIEDWLLVRRVFVLEELQSKVLDHPLIGPMSRALIWNLDREPCLLQNGVFQDAQGNPVPTRPEMECTLWHPLDSGVCAIEVWRDRLFELELTQPIKQAFREVYLLTEAERTTATYSNRFAAHSLRQGQFGALARERGWRFQPAMYAAVTPMAKKPIPGTDLTAEFHFEGIYEWNDSLMVDQATTDHLQFTRAKEPVPLEDIPRDIFSEICRDCDLFVSVASAGNDPTWVDQGLRNARWRDQIETSVFGELAPSAQSRKAVLERLLPRLALGAVSRLEGRWLFVRGKLRTYKIHLGSGNILMSPNDQYLCIVPKSAAEPDLYLPFEGDRMLSIILSKAEMLAKDDVIRDPTIVSQLTQS